MRPAPTGHRQQRVPASRPVPLPPHGSPAPANATPASLSVLPQASSRPAEQGPERQIWFCSGTTPEFHGEPPAHQPQHRHGAGDCCQNLSPHAALHGHGKSTAVACADPGFPPGHKCHMGETRCAVGWATGCVTMGREHQVPFLSKHLGSAAVLSRAKQYHRKPRRKSYTSAPASASHHRSKPQLLPQPRAQVRVLPAPPTLAPPTLGGAGAAQRSGSAQSAPPQGVPPRWLLKLAPRRPPLLSVPPQVLGASLARSGSGWYAAARASQPAQTSRPPGLAGRDGAGVRAPWPRLDRQG